MEKNELSVCGRGGSSSQMEVMLNLRGTEEVLCGRKLSDLEAQGKAVTPAPCASSLGGRYREGPREPFTVRRKEMKVQREGDLNWS